MKVTDEIELEQTKPNEEPSQLTKNKTTIKEFLPRLLSPINDFLDLLDNGIKDFVKSQNSTVKTCFGIIFGIGYLIYFAFAVSLDADRAADLIYVSVFGVVCFIYWLIKKFFGRKIWKGCLKPITILLKARSTYFQWTGAILFVGFFIFWISWDTSKEPNRLVSLAGLVIYIMIGFLGSKNRRKVKWRPVIWGFALQFIFGILILRTTIGYEVFKWLGDRVTKFLSFAAPGAELIFGKSDIFAFTVLPIVIYFSAFTYLLYYLGWMQIIIHKIAWVLQVTMGTSCAESVNSAGNIFLGQTEAPLLIRPFLPTMTRSELHAVLTGGLATIAGSLLAVYILFGVSASHLLSASVMSAPAALAMSKLMYPETEETEVVNIEDTEIGKSIETNVFEALAVGAGMSITLVANISAMMIAFVAVVSLFNGILGWFGRMVGLNGFSFEFICSYVFMPFAFVMGVELKDSFHVAELLGVKTFLTEFISYKRLGELIKNRVWMRDGIKLSIRSEVIATYALCGFANFGSLGVILGCLSAMAPNKRSILSQLLFRALVSATLACFMTACIAGILYDESRYDTAISKRLNLTTAILNMTTFKPKS